MNKASGCDAIPAEPFQVLKMVLLECCTQYASKFGKLSSSHRTEKVGFHSNPKERQSQRMFKLPYNCTHFTCQQSNAQNPQARLQQYVNGEIPDVQAGFRKGRGTRDQIVNIRWITGQARESQKTIYFCFIDYGKAFDCVDLNNSEKF